LPAYLRMIFWPPGCSMMEWSGVAKDAETGIPTRQELSDIVGFPVDNHPARVLGVVLGDRGASQFLAHVDSGMYVK
jgi:hypothetical protein